MPIIPGSFMPIRDRWRSSQTAKARIKSRERARRAKIVDAQITPQAEPEEAF